MNTNNTKNLIFDFGGVLCDLQPDRCLGNFKKLGLDGDLLPRQYSQFDGIFQKLDRGIMTADTFYDTLRKQSSMPDVSNSQIRDAWVSIIDPIQPERYEALRRLKDHFKLYILSNSNEIHWHYIQENLMSYQGEDITNWFDHIFLSHELHLEKPEPELYQAVTDIAHIEPSQSLFIDDSQINLDGASKLGFQTLLSKEGDWTTKLSNMI